MITCITCSHAYVLATLRACFQTNGWRAHDLAGDSDRTTQLKYFCYDENNPRTMI